MLIASTGGNTSSAYEVVRAVGIGSVLLSTAIFVLPLIFGVSVCLVTVFAVAGDFRNIGSSPSLFFAGLYVVLSVALVPWPMLLLALVVGVILGIVLRISAAHLARQPEGSTTRRSLQRAGLLMIGVGTGLWLSISEFGVASEHITLTDGREIVGYYLGNDGTHVTILDDQTRVIAIVATEDVAHRSVCRFDYHFDSRSAIGLFIHADRPPVCPSL